ncbi:ABC transporter ATP-binding protein [Caldinitratiruptor microaerophilus]|uniref:ABC transporter ATP-binding protein n=1 Tax=Caldinitratiruptor microaerophilus TaxID=671077 RepID=A0AA35CKJ1_9FIRM|nr:ABC transporter ATP-binding protein [Caldinitratiruptor microaerophilus]BDG60118.1 ABC transporter ATP-binding protein [Caldinitratiruptor microaerophilus]
MILLEVSGIRCGYGGSVVLHDLSMHVNQGEAVVILGPNGHGKTTLLRAISGLVPLTAGEIKFEGRTISGLEAEEITAAGVVHIPQGDLPFPEMTVEENLLMGAYLPRAWARRGEKLDRVYSLFPRLGERRNQLARTLSGGERRMLALGRGLMSDAKLLMIDEPSLGLAPIVIEEVYTKIKEIAASGLSILLVDENATHAVHVAQRVYLLESGSLVKEGQAGELLMDEALFSAYLG